MGVRGLSTYVFTKISTLAFTNINTFKFAYKHKFFTFEM